MHICIEIDDEIDVYDDDDDDALVSLNLIGHYQGRTWLVLLVKVVLRKSFVTETE